MSVIRVGSNGTYADGWDQIFGGNAKKRTGKKAGKTSAKKAARKPAKKAGKAKKKPVARKKAARRR